MSQDAPHGRMEPDDLERLLVEAWSVRPDPARTAATRAEALVAFGAAGVPARRRRRWLAVVATATALGVGGTAAAAVTPGAVPGDAAYPLKQLGERLRVAAAGSASAEASVWIDLADQRLEEAVRAADRPESMNAALEGYETALRRGQDAAVDSGSTEMRDLVARRTGFHVQVLTALRGSVPASSVAALDRALSVAATQAPDQAPGAGPGRLPEPVAPPYPVPPASGTTRSGPGDGSGAPRSDTPDSDATPGVPTDAPGGAAPGGGPPPAPGQSTARPEPISPRPGPPVGGGGNSAVPGTTPPSHGGPAGPRS